VISENTTGKIINELTNKELNDEEGIEYLGNKLYFTKSEE